MKTINIEIPIDLIDEGETAVLEKIAIQLYENNVFTFGQARRLMNYSVWQFQKLLGEHQINRQYDREDLAEDIEVLRSRLWNNDNYL